VKCVNCGSNNASQLFAEEEMWESSVTSDRMCAVSSKSVQRLRRKISRYQRLIPATEKNLVTSDYRGILEIAIDGDLITLS